MAKIRSTADMSTSLFDLISCALGGVMILMFVFIAILDRGGRELTQDKIPQELGRQFSLIVTDTQGNMVNDASLINQHIPIDRQTWPLSKLPPCHPTKPNCQYKISLISMEKRTTLHKSGQRVSMFNPQDCLSVALEYEKGGAVTSPPGGILRRGCP